MAAASQEARVRLLIASWIAYRSPMSGSTLYCQLKTDLYQVRNPGFNGSPPLAVWPRYLIDTDSEVVAAVEHYFLCRCWVGTGVQPAWQMRAMRNIYDAGKHLGLTPRHNPANPMTPPSALQRTFQNEGIKDGETDRATAGISAPMIAKPPKY